MKHSTAVPTDRRLIRRRGPGAVAAGLALTLLLAACGGDDATTDSPAPTDSPSGTEPPVEDAIAVGIFVDNAFGDGDFFDQAAAAEGLLEAEFGASVSTYEAQLQAQNFAPILQDAADANDLVFVLGFEAIDAMLTVASQNPDTTFVFIDALLGSPDVVSIGFRTAEGCFMAGALAASVSQAAGSDAAGFIGGVDAPVVRNCLAGYEQGVEAVAPGMDVFSQYAGSFVDPSRGSEIATALASRGAFAMFAYAGLTGAGAFDAANSGVAIAPIGVVADKSSLAPGLVPGSLIMGVDSVILNATRAFVAGDLAAGDEVNYGFAEGGWGMVYSDELVSSDQRAVLSGLLADIESGALVITAG